MVVGASCTTQYQWEHDRSCRYSCHYILVSTSLLTGERALSKSNGCLIDLVEAQSQTCSPCHGTSVTGLFRRCIDLIIKVSTRYSQRSRRESTYVEKSVKDSDTQEDGSECGIANIGSCKLLGKDTGESCSNEQRQALHAVLVCSFGTFVGCKDGRRQSLLYVLDVSLASTVGV